VHVIAAVAGLLLIASILWDTFETVLLPRRVPTRQLPSRIVLGGLWRIWSALGRSTRRPPAREGLLAIYPVLALLTLLAVWAGCLILGFALLHLAAGLSMAGPAATPSFVDALYFSGSTFFTLGLGDVHPVSNVARVLTVVEAGTGFGFLAIVIAYLPVLYQSFARREVRVTMLDQWAGSPPSAAVVLRRAFEEGDPEVVQAVLREWEVIASEILESHISYPMLAFFRSHHDNQSWLASLTAVLDTCCLLIAGVPGIKRFQARLTFAIARHAVVDLSQTFHLHPRAADDSRLSAQTLTELRAWLHRAGVEFAEGPETELKLAELRALYEPYVLALSELLLMPLPGWLPPERLRFNWETTTWAKTVRDDAH